MDFLTLCRETARDVGVAAATTSNAVPASVAGNVGELQRIVGYVADAWLEVQGRNFYDFLREEPTLTIPIGANFVAATVPANRYIKDSAYYVQAGGNSRMWLDYLDWDDFRFEYQDTDWLANNRQPTVFSIRRSDNAFVVNANPVGAAIAVRVVRYRNPQKLVADADVPLLPDDLHQLIVEKAKVRYYNNDEAGSARNTAAAEATRLELDLNIRCLPEMGFGGTLLDD